MSGNIEKPKIKIDVNAIPVGTIRNLQDREDLVLTTNKQDIEFIKSYFGNPKWWDFDGCFVKIEHGEYKEVYCFEGTVPTLDKTVYKIVMNVMKVD